MPKLSVNDKQKLAEKLTVTILEQVEITSGAGDRWGRDAAEAYIACYKKLSENDFD